YRPSISGSRKAAQRIIEERIPFRFSVNSPEAREDLGPGGDRRHQPGSPAVRDRPPLDPGEATVPGLRSRRAGRRPGRRGTAPGGAARQRPAPLPAVEAEGVTSTGGDAA